MNGSFSGVSRISVTYSPSVTHGYPVEYYGTDVWENTVNSVFHSCLLTASFSGFLAGFCSFLVVTSSQFFPDTHCFSLLIGFKSFSLFFLCVTSLG